MAPEIDKDERKEIDENIGAQVLTIAEGFEREHEAIRDEHILLTKKGEYFFRGHQRLYYDSEAKDYRFVRDSPDYDPSIDEDGNRVINIYRAHGEAVIAALTIEVPGVNFLPDDSSNANDIDTAKNYSAAALLVQRHNDLEIKYAHAVYLAWISPLVAAYHYAKSDKRYGSVKRPKYKTETETREWYECQACGAEVAEATENCPNCDSPNIKKMGEEYEVQRPDGSEEAPKTRVCIEILNSQYVKVSPFAKTQDDTPYLIYEFEEHVSSARARYPKENIEPTGTDKGWERHGRNPQTFESEDSSMVTTKCVWLRPEAYYYESSEKGELIKSKYPDGIYVEFINDKPMAIRGENLDDFWTLWEMPTSTHIHMNPIGQPLFDPQEVENDIVNLSVDTMKQSIPQTFADPTVLNFDEYSKSELRPGNVYQAKKPANGSLGEGFFTTRTASMSQEIDRFDSKIEQKAQLVVGAFPSIYGGTLQGGSKTYAEYSASRQQALQRLSLVNKAATRWYARMMAKVVPLYVGNLLEDERYTYQTSPGQFLSISIKKDATEGKIGHVEPSASNTLPMSWGQKRDAIMQLIQLNSEEINSVLFSPENASLLVQMSGIPELKIPGDDARSKQYREIMQLIATEPTEMDEGVNPSVQVDPEVDDHIIEAQICRTFLQSKDGQDLKQLNPKGYANVLAHFNQHLAVMKSRTNPAQGPTPAQDTPTGAPENGAVR